MKNNSEKISRLLKELPVSSGVYLMKDIKGRIIYVGKAKNLRARVSSYFHDRELEAKTRALVKSIWDFEVILVQSEVEALLVERSLIKHHQPYYNILLTDDKEYPYVRVNFHDEWPRFAKVRRRKDDGAEYLGPYPSSASLNVVFDLMYQIFPLVRCTPHVFKTVTRPCNYYQMKLCLGPCHLKVEREFYINIVKEACAFLRGNSPAVAQRIKEQMKIAADEENFERASHYRDILQAIESILQKQSVVSSLKEADVIGRYSQQDKSTIAVVQVRGHHIVNQEVYRLNVPLENHEEVMQAFLLQYYENRFIPEEIITADSLADLKRHFNQLWNQPPNTALTAKSVVTKVSGANIMDNAGKSILFTVPKRGKKKDLLDIAFKNAKYNHEQFKQEVQQRNVVLELIKKLLHLEQLPRRIECIDISNLGDVEIVASDVCFIDGKPSKENYRHYKIQQTAGSQNDFAAIHEVVSRRLRRAENDGDAPDILVIDGGKGQLSSALEAAAAFPKSRTKIISLAKSRTQAATYSDTEIVHSDERLLIDIDQEPLTLIPGTAEFRLFTSLRDEAHRVAISFHRKRRDKKTFNSSILNLPGIGPKIYQTLISRFGGLAGLKHASLDELTKIKGLNKMTALTLYVHLNEDVDR